MVPPVPETLGRHDPGAVVVARRLAQLEMRGVARLEAHMSREGML